MRMLEGQKDDLTPLRMADQSRHSSLPSCGFLGHPKGVREFRVIQEARDKLIIQLTGLKAPLDEKIMDDARSRLGEALGKDMCVESQLVDRLDRDPDGKLMKVVSRVNVGPLS
jgi:hypothetical protein